MPSSTSVPHLAENATSALTEADILHRLVEVGDGLAKACEELNQSLAASYFLTALDILRASAELTEELERGRQSAGQVTNSD